MTLKAQLEKVESDLKKIEDKRKEILMKRKKILADIASEEELRRQKRNQEIVDMISQNFGEITADNIEELKGIIKKNIPRKDYAADIISGSDQYGEAR